MAGNMRLTDGGNTVNFSPILGFATPYARREAVNVTISGKRFVHKWHQKRLDDSPLVNVSQADRDQLFTWWDSKTELTWTPDLDGAPGTTFTVKLMNPIFPLQLFHLKDFDVYAGTLVIVEV